MSVHHVITFILWEANSERNLRNLFTKQVNLVEEEYDGGVYEGTVINNFIEESQTLMHTVLKSKKKSNKSD